MGELNTVPMRINRVGGAAGQVKISGGPGVLESWGVPAPAAHVHDATDVTTGQIPLARLVDAVCSETEAPILARALSIGVSDTLRNSNNTAKTTNSDTYVKLKEVLLNADLPACRIKFHLRETTNYRNVLARIYKNGTPIGTERTAKSGDTFSEDFAGFVSGDLIQIYGKLSELGGGCYCEVSNMQFYYNEEISHIGGRDLTTNLPTEEDPTISITNQDP